jgi:hypothetical protein
VCTRGQNLVVRLVADDLQAEPQDGVSADPGG